MRTAYMISVISICMYGCASKKAMTSGEQKAPVAQASFKYDFGGDAATGYTKVTASSMYSDDAGYGFEKGSTVTTVVRGGSNVIQDGFTTSDKPFFFSVKVPEGNYNVKVIVGDKDGASDAAIRAECRRMMVNRVQTKQSQARTVEFTLHIRDSIIRSSEGNSKVRLKPREIAYWHWDNKLTLEFNGNEPKISVIEITPADSSVVT